MIAPFTATASQTSLFVEPGPDVADFDVILVNTSAGKDSQAALDVICELARGVGALDRVIAVHCDLGRVEWPGTRELAAEHAAHYGVRFEVIARAQDLLDQIAQRGMFPSSTARYCTSDHKTSQVRKLMTRVVAELRSPGAPCEGRPVRILNVLGIRGQESAARAKKPAISVDAASNGRRHVIRWLPIHQWSTAEVWHRIRAAKTRHHYAYDLGMSRLSCAFCVLASRADLRVSLAHNRALAADIAAVEVRIGHRFTHAASMTELIAEADRDVARPG